MAERRPCVMDEKVYLDVYGERDHTTTFMRSRRMFPEVDDIFKNDAIGLRQRTVRVAIVGCSFGQEVYSYALMLKTNGASDYRVTGFDVHENVLTVGREGWYHLESADYFEGYPTEAAELIRQRKGRFRTQGITFKKDVLTKVDFSQHDISIDALPEQYDIVVCTNMLGQIQRGGNRRATENVVASVAENGIAITNYDRCLDILPYGISQKREGKLKTLST